MALDRKAMNKAYEDFRRLSEKERYAVSKTFHLPDDGYGHGCNADLFFKPPVTVTYNIKSFNSFGLAYIKSLAWNLIKNVFVYGTAYLITSAIIIVIINENFPEYMPYRYMPPSAVDPIFIMLIGMLGPLLVHGIWATMVRHETKWKELKYQFRVRNERNHSMLENWNTLSDKEKAKRVSKV